MENILELDQICDIADNVYWEVISKLDIIDKCVEDDEDNDEGTRNTEYGSELYYLIENAIMSSIDYQNKNYTCPKFEPTED